MMHALIYLYKSIYRVSWPAAADLEHVLHLVVNLLEGGAPRRLPLPAVAHQAATTRSTHGPPHLTQQYQLYRRSCSTQPAAKDVNMVLLNSHNKYRYTDRLPQLIQQV